MENNRKILMVLKKLCYNYDGASKVLTLLANMLAEQENEVTVFVYSGIVDDCHLNPKVQLLTGDADRSLISKALSVRKVMKEVRPGVTVSFITNANAISTVSALGLKIPVIVCERSDPYLETNKKISMMRWVYRFSSGAVFQTEGAQAYYSWIRRSAVIPNPVEKPSVHVDTSFKERDNTIAVVSRLDIQQKRLDVMLKAFSIFHQRYPEYKMNIYGDGLKENRQIVESLIVDFDLESAVVLHGKISDVETKIAHDKMYVLSSDYEGIPNSLLEAMSIGLPCISTDCSPGGAKLLIQNEKNGLLVKCENPEMLAEAMMRYAEDPAFADRMGQKASEVSDRFAPEKIWSMWREFIYSVAKEL